MARAGSCHVESDRTQRLEPGAKAVCSLRERELVEIEVKQRPSGCGGFAERQQRASRKRTVREDERGVGIANVENGAKSKIRGVGFEEADVPVRNGPVLREAPLGDPATSRDVVGDREVEGGSVGASLPSGDDLPRELEHSTSRGRNRRGTRHTPLSGGQDVAVRFLSSARSACSRSSSTAEWSANCIARAIARCPATSAMARCIAWQMRR